MIGNFKNFHSLNTSILNKVKSDHLELVGVKG